MEDDTGVLTVAVCTAGLPDLKAWNAELAGQRLDVVIFPATPEEAADNRIAVGVYEEIVTLEFGAAPVEAREEWFPTGLYSGSQPMGAARLAWRRDDLRAGAAAWSVAAALAHLSSGSVFEGAGVAATTALEPSVGYERARALVDAILGGDLQFDVEASTRALVESMLQSHDELFRKSTKPLPHDT